MSESINFYAGENKMQSPDSVAAPWFKAITAILAGYGIASWGDFAAAMAALYSICLIAEWLWKKCLRGFCQRRGWVQMKYKRWSDAKV